MYETVIPNSVLFTPGEKAAIRMAARAARDNGYFVCCPTEEEKNLLDMQLEFTYNAILALIDEEDKNANLG